MHKVAIGCDPNAAAAKKEIIALLDAEGYEVKDLGSEDPIYAHTAFAVGDCINAGTCDRGILICGTGLGMSIAANKVKGIRAALVTDVYSAQRARKSNDCQIACFGAFTQGIAVMKELVKVFLTSEFDPKSPSAPKVAAIMDRE